MGKTMKTFLTKNSIMMHASITLAVLLAVPGLCRASTYSTLSMMALNWEQPNYIESHNYRYVIIQDYMYASIPTIRANNPNAKILAYCDMSASNSDCTGDQHRSTGVSYCYANTYHPEWFLLNKNGQRVFFESWNYLAAMDIGNTAYQTEWKNWAINHIKGHGFDGVFVDDCNMTPGHGMNDGQANDLAKYTDAQYRDATVAFIASVGPALKAQGLFVLPNVGCNPWDLTSVNVAIGIMPNVSGYFREHWMHWNADLAGVFTDATWTDTLALMERVNGTSAIFLANTYGMPSETAAMRYGRASFLLGWKGNESAFQFRADGAVDSYNNEWGIDIGDPAGSRYQVGSAWRREFTAGTAIVNPSSSSSATISLGGTYTDLAGNSYTSITLQPAAAIILRKASGPNIALNRPATASSTEAAGQEPSKAVDGNSSTRWSSLYSDPQWIRIDLGSSKTIRRVKLNWEAAYGRSYKIQVSGNGSKWTDIYSTTTGDGGIDDLTVNGTGRYVRMYGTQRGTGWGYSLWEFEIYQ
jgi:hypothetical protein